MNVTIRTPKLVPMLILLLFAGIGVGSLTARLLPQTTLSGGPGVAYAGALFDEGTTPLTPVGSAFTYQGHLLNGGSPVSGLYDFTFKLYDALAVGNQVGSTITVSNQTVSNGLFTLSLDFGSAAFQGSDRWLEIAVRPSAGGGYTTLTPRQELTAAPYASGLRPGAVITSTTAGTLLAASNSGTGIGLYGSSTGGTGVYGQSAATRGVYGISLATNGEGVYGTANNGTSASGVYGSSSSGIGVYGTSSAFDGEGVFGSASNGTNASGVLGLSNSGNGVYGVSTNGSGVRGLSTSFFGHGVHGEATDERGSGVFGESTIGEGVRGESDSDTGVIGVSATSHGVSGTSESGDAVHASSTSGDGVHAGSGSGRGVYGRSFSNHGVYGISEGTAFNGKGVYGVTLSTNGDGVYGVANNGSTANAVYGTSSGGRGVYGIGRIGVFGVQDTGGDWAGYFSGDVNVTGGCCAAGAGSTRIDHPLDPANKYLSQALVESPNMMNIYNGNVTTNANGEAVVALPGYVEALNHDFRYQLTVVGQFARAIVASEVENNRFTIKTDKPNVKVSWQVTGIRKDAYAEAHPIEIETDKPQDEHGKYRHPIEHGQPESKGVDYEQTRERIERSRDEGTTGEGAKP